MRTGVFCASSIRVIAPPRLPVAPTTRITAGLLSQGNCGVAESSEYPALVPVNLSRTCESIFGFSSLTQVLVQGYPPILRCTTKKTHIFLAAFLPLPPHVMLWASSVRQ